MENKKKFLLFIIIICINILNCNGFELKGEYYIERSNTKIKIDEKKLYAEEDNNPLFTAYLEKNENDTFTYVIQEIYIKGIYETFSSNKINKGSKIYIKKYVTNNGNVYSDFLPKENERLNIEANFYGNKFIYGLNSQPESYIFINSRQLREYEKSSIMNSNFTKLTDFYNLQLINTQNKALSKAVQYLFDEDIGTNIILPEEFAEKVGVELSIQSKKKEDIDTDFKNYTLYDDNERTENNFNILGLVIEIDESSFYEYNRPKTLHIYYTKTNKDNPGYKEKLYEYHTTINIEDSPEKQIFYFMNKVPKCKTILIKVENSYKGLSDKIGISNMNFILNNSIQKR